jgi:hypothetical protein
MRIDRIEVLSEKRLEVLLVREEDLGDERPGKGLSE